MPRRILIFMFMFGSLTIAQWEIVHEGGSGYINDIDFFNENIGWIACGNEVLLTTDGGESWIEVYGNITESDIYRNTNLKAYFVNSTTGWIVRNDSILKTNDVGQSWEYQLYVNVIKIQALNENTLFIGGYEEFMKSENSGHDWEKITFPNSAQSVQDFYFINNNYGFISQHRTDPDGITEKIILYKTVDGGKTWNDLITFDDTFGSKDLFFLDDKLGYIRIYSWGRRESDSQLYSTSDSGKTWQKMMEHVSSFSVPSPGEIYLAVNEESFESAFQPHGRILKSTDSGITWTEEYGKNVFFHDLCITKNGRSFLIEGFRISWGGSIGQILLENDIDFNKENWEIIKTTLPSTLTSIELLSDQKWIIGGWDGGFHWGYSGLFLTWNAGIDYDLIMNSELYSTQDSYSFCDQNTGYYSSDGIYRTEDGGITWNQISKYDPINGTLFSRLFFISPDIGWGIGYNPESGPSIFKTIDGAQSWEANWDEIWDPVIMHFIDGNHGWAIYKSWAAFQNENNHLLKYDSTDTWTDIHEFKGEMEFKKIEFIDKDTGIILGEEFRDGYSRSILLRTTDGGFIWNDIYDMEYFINDFSFLKDGRGWAVGQGNKGNGVILGLYDFGNSWYVESDIFSSALYSVSINDSLSVAVGENGQIISSTDQVHKYAVPKTFSISDRYFNSQLDTLKIKAELMNPGNSSLFVFAIIENEDSTITDSIALFDDGFHEDSLADDNIWSGKRNLIDLEEDMYKVKLIIYDKDFNTTHEFHKEQYFTTAGPVKLDTLSFINYDGNPNIFIYPMSLHNYGLTKTIINVTAEIESQDTHIVKIQRGIGYFKDIPPGESNKLSVPLYYSLRIASGVEKFKLNLYIRSNDMVFWLDTIEADLSKMTGIDKSNDLPTEYALFQNYPNPFNPSTTIIYSLPAEVKIKNSKLKNVVLKIYDILGREVTTLVNEQQKPGYYEVVWNPSAEGLAQSSGVYFYKLRAGEFVSVKKMVYLK